MLQVLNMVEKDNLICNCSSDCLQKSYDVDISSSVWPAQQYEMVAARSFVLPVNHSGNFFNTYKISKSCKFDFLGENLPNKNVFHWGGNIQLRIRILCENCSYEGPAPTLSWRTFPKRRTQLKRSPTIF